MKTKRNYILPALSIVLALCFLISCGKNKTKDGGENIENNYDFDMTEYITVPELRDVVVKDSDIEKEWQHAALKVRLDSTSYELLEDEDASSAEFDKLNISYSLSSSEKTLSGAVKRLLESDSFDLILGSGDFIPAYENKTDPLRNTEGFEDQLIGTKKGDALKVIVTFADDYSFTDTNGNSSMVLAGVRCEFDVTVKSISRGEVPELDNILVARYTTNECTTVDEYKEYIYSYFRSVYAYEAFYNAVTLKEFPEERLYEARLTYITNIINENYKNADLDDEDIETLYDYYYDEAEMYARKAVFERMVLEYLFKACGISMSYSEYRALLENDYSASAAIYYMSFGVMSIEEYEEYMGRENLYLQYRYERLLEVLPGRVTIES